MAIYDARMDEPEMGKLVLLYDAVGPRLCKNNQRKVEWNKNNPYKFARLYKSITGPRWFVCVPEDSSYGYITSLEHAYYWMPLSFEEGSNL